MFLNGLCRQPELQISENDTCSPEILYFLHLNAKEGQEKKKKKVEKVLFMLLRGKSGSACRTNAQLWIKNRCFIIAALLFLSSLSGILQQNLACYRLVLKMQKLLKKNIKSNEQCIIVP